MDPPARHRLACLAWGSATTRADELARALGGESRRFGGLGLRGRPSAPLRYLLNAPRTLVWLARHRPAAVLVQNPPVALALVALAWCRLTGARFALDSHPAAFGRKHASPLVSMLPVHRRLARRAAVVLAPSQTLAGEVRAWGGRALVVHEAPPAWLPDPAARRDGTPTVLFVCTFASDDPVAAAVAAAASVPHARMLVTGAHERADGRLPQPLPANVELVGMLGHDAYLTALRRADVVLGLTTEPESALRCGYEAIYAEVPLVCSDWPLLRELFPRAIHVDNTSSAIGAGLAVALRDNAALRADAPGARKDAEQRWRTQLTNLRGALLGQSPDVR